MARTSAASGSGFRPIAGGSTISCCGRRSVSLGDPDLQTAQNEAGHILDGNVYRMETVFIGSVGDDPSRESPKGPRYRLLPVMHRNLFFVSAEDSSALRRRDDNPQWGAAAAE